MSISYIQQPGSLCFSKNPIVYKLETDNYETVAGVKAYVDFSCVVLSGETLIFTWPLGSVTFIGHHEIDNTGNKVILYEGGAEGDYIANSLFPDLQTNQLLFDNFDISTYDDGGTIYIRVQAKEAGEDFTVVLTGTANIGTPTEVAGVDRVVRENFRIVLEVMFYNGSAYEKIITLEQEPDVDFAVEFDIQDYLDRRLSGDLPTYNSEDIELCTNPLRKFYVRWHEKYGDPIIHHRVTVSEVKEVILGGMKKQDWPSNTLISNLTSSSKRFLTWHPADKRVGRLQQEYLYYLITAVITQVRLRILITLSDGSTQLANILTYDPANPGEKEILAIPTGFTQLGLSDYETGDLTVVKYKVWIANQSTIARSEERTYYVDETTYQQERHFLYRTSLGGAYETLRTTEEAEKSMPLDYEISEKIIPSDYTSKTGQREKINIAFEEIFSVSTGLIDKELKLSLQDFLISKDVYEIINGKFVSIQIINKDEVIIDEREDLHPLIIKYKYNYLNSAFSSL